MPGLIYVNYQNSAETIASVKNFMADCEPIEFKIYIVDNGSKKQSVDMLYEVFGSVDGVILHCLENNYGFSYGVNEGLKRSRKDGNRHHFICNPDTRFHHQTLRRLVEFSVRKKLDIVSPLLVDENGVVDDNIFRKRRSLIDYIVRFGLIGSILPFKDKVGKFYPDGDGNLVVGDVISGAFFLIADQSVALVTLDSELFLYLEEYALAEFCEQNSKRIGICTKESVVHLTDHKSGEQNLSKKYELERLSLQVYLKKYRKYRKITIKAILLNLYLKQLIVLTKKKYDFVFR